MLVKLVVAGRLTRNLHYLLEAHPINKTLPTVVAHSSARFYKAGEHEFDFLCHYAEI